MTLDGLFSLQRFKNKLSKHSILESWILNKQLIFNVKDSVLRITTHAGYF